MAQTATQQQAAGTVVVGLGGTGLSCTRFLRRLGEPVTVMDSRSEPPGAAALRAEFPEVPTLFGAFDAAPLQRAGRVVVSPGVAWDEPALVAARAAGIEVIGDIELFARHADAPVVAITGSNGKSTVTTLLGEMAKAAGRDVRIGGNLGTPALDLLGGRPDLYVLELSSFQLEATNSLRPLAAVVLNVSDDHLDRHGTIANYAAIKAQVYAGDGVVVVNVDDPMVAAMARPGRTMLTFSTVQPADTVDYGLMQCDGEAWLARRGEPLVAARALRIAGRHNWANALAALALGEGAGLPRAAMLDALRAFPGLPHRCQWIAERSGVAWYEDSKGTNVGATLAALQGMPGDKVVLIAGGLGKGADFGPLRPAVAERARAVVLIGRDAPLIEAAIGGAAPVAHAGDMDDAVAQAAALAHAGDVVLLSPACASFDMFANYAARADAFVAAVRKVTA